MERPWLSEPNREEFRHEGFPCLLNRAPSGAWCGYVAVSPGHPLHGVGYGEEAPALLALWEERKQRPIGENPGMGLLLAALGGNDKATPDRVLEVHGGITFADSCQKGGPICHVPEPGEIDNVWWFGFDCAHCDDFAPKHDDPDSDSNRHMRAHYPDWTPIEWPGRPKVYRDIEYARAQTLRLAEQLRALV